MVRELEKLKEQVHYLRCSNESNDQLIKATEKLESIVTRNHFLNRNEYEKSINSIKELINTFEEEQNNLFGSNKHLNILHKKLQHKITLLAKTILDENKKIFIVHGRNLNMRDKVAATLGKLRLEYVILETEQSEGVTLIEKFLKKADDCRYAIILFSADDVGKLKRDQGEAKYRPRQNVVLELGFFLSHVGRKNIFTLHEKTSEHLEKPTDFDGIVYEPFDEHGAWRTKLVRELRTSGVYIDQSRADTI